MPIFTVIHRVYKPLILVESMEFDENMSEQNYRDQAKRLLEQISKGSEKTGIITSNQHYFLYIIDNGVCYMTLCDQSYPKRLAYSFLEEIKKEFDYIHGRDVQDAKRPYAFENFDTFIHKTKKLYMDTKSQRNLNKVASDLKDINKIMTKSAQDILERGVIIDEVHDRSEALGLQAKSYESMAVQLNLMYFWRKYGPIMGGGVFVLLLIVVRFWWF